MVLTFKTFYPDTSTQKWGRIKKYRIIVWIRNLSKILVSSYYQAFSGTNLHSLSKSNNLYCVYCLVWKLCSDVCKSLAVWWGFLNKALSTVITDTVGEILCFRSRMCSFQGLVTSILKLQNLPILGAVHLLRHTIFTSSGPPPTPLSYCVIVWLTPPYPPHVWRDKWIYFFIKQVFLDIILNG